MYIPWEKARRGCLRAAWFGHRAVLLAVLRAAEGAWLRGCVVRDEDAMRGDRKINVICSWVAGVRLGIVCVLVR